MLFFEVNQVSTKGVALRVKTTITSESLDFRSTLTKSYPIPGVQLVERELALFHPFTTMVN